MRNGNKGRTDLAHLREGLDKIRQASPAADSPPWDSDTVGERAWHILEYRPDEDRTYYIGPTTDNTPTENRAFLTHQDFLDFLLGDNVICELEK